MFVKPGRGRDAAGAKDMPKDGRKRNWPHGDIPDGSTSEHAFLRPLDIADDEPTQLGQSLDVIAVAERAVAKDRKRAIEASATRQPGATTAVVKPTAPQPQTSGAKSSDEGSIKPTGYVKVVATVTDPPQSVQDLPFIDENAIDSPVAASFRVLRHRLREADNPSIIAVTSPDRHEGKTTCAINLAMALAEHGRERVLLVEANLRFPRLAAALGFDTPSCFAKQMEAHLKEPLAPWEMVAAFFHNLHVLAVDRTTVGQYRLNAPSLRLAMGHFQSSGYKHIIVDCPPALGSADVNVIEDTTDGVLLTARTGQTTGESLKTTKRHLAPANILGVVLM